MTLVDGLDVAILRVDDLSKSYAARGASGRTRAIDSISFEVAHSWWPHSWKAVNRCEVCDSEK